MATRLAVILALLAHLLLSGCSASTNAKLTLEPHDRPDASPGVTLSGDWSLDVSFPKLRGTP